jgi:hypothetical protein
MLAGISDAKAAPTLDGTAGVSKRVWGMMTEFKVNLDLEKQVIKRDVKNLELQLAESRGYLDQLHTLKRKVDTAKRLLKVAANQEDIESKDR